MSKYLSAIVFSLSTLCASCSPRMMYGHSIMLYNHCHFSIDVSVVAYSNLGEREKHFAILPSRYGSVFNYVSYVEDIDRAVSDEYRLELRAGEERVVLGKNKLISRLSPGDGGKGHWRIYFDDFCKK